MMTCEDQFFLRTRNAKKGDLSKALVAMCSGLKSFLKEYCCAYGTTEVISFIMTKDEMTKYIYVHLVPT
jgi:hypothetical protein